MDLSRLYEYSAIEGRVCMSVNSGTYILWSFHRAEVSSKKLGWETVNMLS